MHRRFPYRRTLRVRVRHVVAPGVAEWREYNYRSGAKSPTGAIRSAERAARQRFRNWLEIEVERHPDAPVWSFDVFCPARWTEVA